MRKKLEFKELLLIGLLLFGLFFGAGNLIFPLQLGQESGSNLTPVTIGFLISGVGLPIIGVAAVALADSKSLFELSMPAGRFFAYFFTVLLYITIGPGFAMPRTASMSYETSLADIVAGSSMSNTLALLLFSLIFFVLAYYFSSNRANLIDVIGKYMTPLLLILLGVLVILGLINPMGPVAGHMPTEKYITSPFTKGIIDGYNTLDAPASLAFAVIIIAEIKRMRISEPSAIATETLKASLVCLVGMSMVYVALAYLGSTSHLIMEAGNNGAYILAQISNHYLGRFGHLMLGLIVTIACLKTSIGLITACSEIFLEIFDNKITYKQYCMIFAVVSFLIANLGLSKIIALSLPVLLFLYPLSIALIFLAMTSIKIGKRPTVYKWTLAFTAVIAFFDFLKATPEFISGSALSQSLLKLPASLPGFELGFAWIIPALIGFILGLIIDNTRNKSRI